MKATARSNTCATALGKANETLVWGKTKTQSWRRTAKGAGCQRLTFELRGSPAVWRTGQQAQNGPQALRLMVSVPCRWASPLNEGLGGTLAPDRHRPSTELKLALVT
jgi:hypothetical protein